MKNIEIERYSNNFENKLKDIKFKLLLLDLDEIPAKV